MNKSRILVSAVLTAGLGLTGVVSASESGAAAPDRAASAKPGQGPTTGKAPGKAHGGGPVVFCVIHKAPGGGKPGLPAPGKPGKPGPGKPGKLSKTTVRIVNGKVYINGKLVPKSKLNSKCPLPPLPPLPPIKGGKPGKPVIGTGVGTGVGPGVSIGGVVIKGAPGSVKSGTVESGSTASSSVESGSTASGMTTSALLG